MYNILYDLGLYILNKEWQSEETWHKISLLVRLVSATAFISLLCYKCVLSRVIYLTSNEFSITYPCDKVIRFDKG